MAHSPSLGADFFLFQLSTLNQNMIQVVAEASEQRNRLFLINKNFECLCHPISDILFIFTIFN